MDDEILKTVESMLGKDIKIVDCEKTSSVREEEILLINGIPVQLEGDDGDAIKSALMTGQVPPCDLLNQLLYRAGILRQPVHLETSLSVKSSLIRKEEVTIARDGRILDERTSETHEDNIYTSSCQEIWEPINKIGTGPLKRIVPNPVEQCLRGDGQAFLLTVPTQDGPLPPSTVQNSASTIAPSSSTASATSASSSSSSSASSSSNNTTAGKSSIFTDCSASSLLLTGTASPFKRTADKGRRHVMNAVKGDDDDKDELEIGGQIQRNNNNNNSSKRLTNSMSYDSGHGELISQSPILPNARTATPTFNSNSISSCCDFISSDETDFVSSKDPMTPSIFGTVASDHIPKDSINRRGFPQTVASSSTKSIDKNQSKYQSHHSTISAPVTSEQQQPHHHHHQQQAPTITPATATATTHHHQQLENDDNALVYRDGYLISGPLNTLVQHMVPTSDYYPDRSYLFAFLLSARLFIRPHELLAKICQLCDDQQSFSSCWTASTQSNETLIDQHDSIASSSHHPKQSVPDLPNDTTTTSSSSASNNGDCCRKLRSFAQHFVQLLAEWIETFPYDFRDERLMQHVRSMTRKCISIDSALRKDVSTILQNLLQRLTVLEKYEEFLISLSRGGGSGGTADTHLDQSSNERTTKSSVLTIQNNLQSADNSQSSHHYHLHHQSAASQPLTGSLNTSTTTTSSSAATSIDISELCPSPTLLAHQLTHIELERLSYIGPEEFVQAFAKENPHLEQSFSDMKKTRNLESYVQWFNRLSYLVATEIVKHPKKKQRVRIVEYWIETARECFNIGNFNSLMAIIAGLNMSPISRLKKTWAKVQSAKFSVLEHQMDPSSNFNSYRSTLKAAMWRSAGATDERERIVIPFFSLLVKDLYFLNEGCSNKLSNGHINFEKFWQLAKQVTEFIAWKQVTCPFEKLPKVIMFLQTNNVLNENTLAMASFECEPPDNNHEKDRYKSLKSEQQHHSHHHQ